jgi:hypothetical protein
MMRRDAERRAPRPRRLRILDGSKDMGGSAASAATEVTLDVSRTREKRGRSPASAREARR